MLIRYFLDEHIFPAVASALRQRGIDAVTVGELGRTGFSDEEQLAFALSENRVIVTRDKDFLILHSQGTAHAGIVRWYSKRQSYRVLIQKLATLWRTTTAEEMVGRVQYF